MTDADAKIIDYAIVGAGVSGLTLAWLLGESSLAGHSILLIDSARRSAKPRCALLHMRNIA